MAKIAIILEIPLELLMIQFQLLQKYVHYLKNENVNTSNVLSAMAGDNIA